MLIVGVSIITLIISFITAIISVLMAMKLNQIPYMQPIQIGENLTQIKDEFVATKQIIMKENKIAVQDSVIGNLQLETPLTYLKLNSERIELYAKDELSIKSKKEKLFPPDFNKIKFIPVSQLTVSSGLQNVHKVRSPTDQNLEIKVNNLLTLKGNNGLNLDGKQIQLKSDQIWISSLNSTINLDSTNGEVYFQFDNENNNGKTADAQDLEPDNYQHKLCVCANNGLIFKLMVKDNLTKCSDVRFPVSTNPCTRQSRI